MPQSQHSEFTGMAKQNKPLFKDADSSGPYTRSCVNYATKAFSILNTCDSYSRVFISWNCLKREWSGSLKMTLAFEEDKRALLGHLAQQ